MCSRGYQEADGGDPHWYRLEDDEADDSFQCVPTVVESPHTLHGGLRGGGDATYARSRGGARGRRHSR